jgi:hypothetical protein
MFLAFYVAKLKTSKQQYLVSLTRAKPSPHRSFLTACSLDAPLVLHLSFTCATAAAAAAAVVGEF